MEGTSSTYLISSKRSYNISHVICVKTAFKNLDALERACKNLGWTLNRGKKTYKWYGTWVNDYSQEDAAYRMGVKTSDYGKCEASITIPGCSYEAGLVKGENEGEFNLIFDNYDSNLASVLGGKFHPTVVNPLPQEYAKEAFLDKLKSSELDVWSVSDTKDENGNVHLEIEVND